jgi:hypothetical protein
MDYTFNKNEIKILQYAMSFFMANLDSANEALNTKLTEPKLQSLLNKIQAY